MRIPPQSWMQEGSAAALAFAMLLLFGCVVSPRRIVENTNPFPSPTPTGTPTPSPTATPSPMSAVAQFLFTADTASRVITENRIEADGTLASIAQPLRVSETPLAIAAVHGTLIVAGESSLLAFVVDKETGAIRQTDSAPIAGVSTLRSDSATGLVQGTSLSGSFVFRAEQGKIEDLSDRETTTPANAQIERIAALDSTGKFFYVLDPGSAQISVFRVNGERLSPLISYPVSRTTSSIALATP